MGMAALLGLGTAALAQTYTSASTTYSFIDSSTHSKIGFNTTPYKFNGTGCGTAPPTLDDTLSDAIPIGFTFTFGTTGYTTVRVMTNGRLQFNNTTCGSGTANIGPPQTYPYGYPNGSMNATMKVFGVDLDPTNLVNRPNYPSAANKTPCTSSSTCYMSFATIGTAPSRQFVVTWKNVPEWVAASNTSGSFDLQVILNEDGTFIYQYGNIVHGGTGIAQIGWQLTTTNFQVLAFGASAEPPPFTAIKFYLPAPLAGEGRGA
jgi:MSHA biogenesis protein MshQ